MTIINVVVEAATHKAKPTEHRLSDGSRGLTPEEGELQAKV
jgi:hypothetical protein